MRKVHSPHGNVGPNIKNDFDSVNKTRCNICDFCNGIDGFRKMSKDPDDPTGGHICNKCKAPIGHVNYSELEDDWFKDAIEASKHTVDGERNYDEMIEDLISDWEKSQDR